jgi:hypothetical protein
MRKPGRIAFLGVGLLLAAGTLDCFAHGQKDGDAMECCRSMPCTPANQSHDCCKKMVSAPGIYFVVPQRTLAPAPSVQILAVVTTTAVAMTTEPPHVACCPEAREHAPPAELPSLYETLRI